MAAGMVDSLVVSSVVMTAVSLVYVSVFLLVEQKVVWIVATKVSSWSEKLASSMVELMVYFSDEMMAESWDGLRAGMMAE